MDTGTPASAGDPRRERERELHRRLLAGERRATALLISHFLPRLRAFLRCEFPGLRNDDDREECGLAALSDYFRAPRERVSEGDSPAAFLYLAARRNALNRLAQQERWVQRGLSLEEDKVAGEAPARNGWVEEQLGILPGLPDEVTIEELQARVRAAVKPGDRAVLALLLSGDEPVESYVRALGLDGLSRGDQGREVKRAKDRVWAALRRLRQRYEDE
jgi:DNA-directed RNA polymerase specialized sigma24 family protein